MISAVGHETDFTIADFIAGCTNTIITAGLAVFEYDTFEIH